MMLVPMTTDRRTNERLLLEVTQVPTAAGREGRVGLFVEAWVRERAGMSLTRDGCGNLFITSDAIARASLRAGGGHGATGSRPVFFTAHLDHPAMVVERVLAPGALELSLRGGVMQDYLKNADIEVVDRNDVRHSARLGGEPSGEADGFKLHVCELERSTDSIMPGDVAVWALPTAEIENGIIRTNACDDLAALASALCAFDALHALDNAVARLCLEDVREELPSLMYSRRAGPARRSVLRAAPMRSSACAERKRLHCRSSDQKLARTRAATATVNQQALQRASNSGGGSR